MPNRYLNQHAVVWPPAGTDAYGRALRGEPVAYGPDQPGERKVAWRKTRRQSVNAQGAPVALDATMITLHALAVRSLVYLGPIDDLTGTGLGDPVPDGVEVYEVDRCDADEDLKGRTDEFEVKLVRYRAGLPSEG